MNDLPFRFVPLLALSSVLLAAACADSTGPAGVPASGGVVESGDGGATLVIPAGALSAETPITVQKADVVDEDPNLVPGTAYDFQPDGLEFETPAMLELRYDPATLPEGAAPERLRIFERVGSSWRIDSEEAVVDPVEGTVTAPIAGFSVHSVMLDPCAPVALEPPAEVRGTITPSDCPGPDGETVQVFSLEATSQTAWALDINTNRMAPVVGVTDPGRDMAGRRILGFRADPDHEAGGWAQLLLLAAPGSYQVYAGSVDGDTRFLDDFRLSVRTNEETHATGCGRGIFVLPPVTSAQDLSRRTDCQVTIRHSPVPELIGKTTTEEYFFVKVGAGQTLSVTASRTGGDSAFAPFPTLFVGGGQVVQDPATDTEVRTVEFTAPRDQWVSVGVSAVFDFSGPEPVSTEGTYELAVTLD